jgi:hypothetical protein
MVRIRFSSTFPSSGEGLSHDRETEAESELPCSEIQNGQGADSGEFPGICDSEEHVGDVDIGTCEDDFGDDEDSDDIGNVNSLEDSYEEGYAKGHHKGCVHAWAVGYAKAHLQRRRCENGYHYHCRCECECHRDDVHTNDSHPGTSFQDGYRTGFSDGYQDAFDLGYDERNDEDGSDILDPEYGDEFDTDYDLDHNTGHDTDDTHYNSGYEAESCDDLNRNK